MFTRTAEYLIETGDRCIRLARGHREAADELEIVGRELHAKAVELDTARQKREGGKAAE